MKIHRSRYALSVFFLCFLMSSNANPTALDDLQSTLNVLKAKLVDLAGQLSNLAGKAPSTSGSTSPALSPEQVLQKYAAYSYIDEFVDDPNNEFLEYDANPTDPTKRHKFSAILKQDLKYDIENQFTALVGGMLDTVNVTIDNFFDPDTSLNDRQVSAAFRSVCTFLKELLKKEVFFSSLLAKLREEPWEHTQKTKLINKLALAYTHVKINYISNGNLQYFKWIIQTLLQPVHGDTNQQIIDAARNCAKLLLQNIHKEHKIWHLNSDTLQKMIETVMAASPTPDREDIQQDLLTFLHILQQKQASGSTSGTSQTAAEHLADALTRNMPGAFSDLNIKIEWTRNHIGTLRQLLNDAVEESSTKAETIPAPTGSVAPALFEKYARLIDPYFDPNSDIVAADLGNPERFDATYTAFENFVSNEITAEDVENLKIFVPQYIDQVLGKYAEFKEMGTPKIGLNILTPFDAGQARITLQQRITEMNINFDNVFDILTQAIQSPHLIQQIVPLGEIVLNNILPNEIIGYALLDHVNPTEDAYNPTKYANKIRQIIDFCVVLFSKKIPPNNEPAKSFEDGYNSLIAQLKLQRGSLLCAYMLLKAGSDNPRFLEWLHHEQFLVWALKAAMYYIDQEANFDNTPARTELYIIYEILKHVQRSTSGSDALLAACRAYTQEISTIAGEPNEGKFDKPEYDNNGWQIKRNIFRTILARKLLEAAYRYEAGQRKALQKIAEQEALIIHLDAQKRHQEELERQRQAKANKREEERIAALADQEEQKKATAALKLANDERIRQAEAGAAAAKAQEDAAEQQRLATLQATFQQEEFKTTPTKPFASNNPKSINALSGWIEKTLIPDAQQSTALRPGGAPYIASFNLTGESAAGCKKTDIIGWLKWLVKCHEEAKDTSKASSGILESLKKQTIGTDNCYEIAMKHTTIIVQNILQDSDSLRTNLIQINSEALVPIANFCKLLIENNTATFADFQVVHNYELIADFIYLTAIPTSKQEKPKLSAIASHIATAGQTQKPFARKCATLMTLYINGFYKSKQLKAIKDALINHLADPEAKELVSAINKLASSSDPSEAASSS